MTIDDEIELVVARRHWDPHHVLGAHPVEGGILVRAFRPDARTVLARLDGGERVALEQRHRAGLFEASLRGATLPVRYELEVSYPTSLRSTTHTPTCHSSGTSICISLEKVATSGSTISWGLTCARSTA